VISRRKRVTGELELITTLLRERNRRERIFHAVGVDRELFCDRKRIRSPENLEAGDSAR
jgi:hypothetical protein